MLRSPIRLRYDDEDDDVSHCNAERILCDVFSPDTQQDIRRSSFAHSSNGKTKYRSNEKIRDGISPIVANETCIWSPAYSGEKRKKCARIIRTTCILDKKVPCRFRVHNETDTDAVHYPELRSNFQKQICRNILPEEHVYRRNESNFVESCVWIT